MTPNNDPKVTLNTPGLDALVRATENGLNAPEFEDWRTQATARYSTFVGRRYDDYSRGAGDWPALAMSTVEARRGPARGRAGKGGGSRDGDGARSSLARETRQSRVDKSLRRARFMDPRGAFIAPLVNANRTVSILKDTGLLRMALTVGAPGNYVKGLNNGIEFGFDRTGHRPKPQAPKAKPAKGKTRAGRGELPKIKKTARGPSYADLATWHNNGTPRIPKRLILALPSEQVMGSIMTDLHRAFAKIAQRAQAGGRKRG